MKNIRSFNCDLCGTLYDEKLGGSKIKIDFRNTPNNSGGKNGEWHFCSSCRIKSIEISREVANMVDEKIKVMKNEMSKVQKV